MATIKIVIKRIDHNCLSQSSQSFPFVKHLGISEGNEKQILKGSRDFYKPLWNRNSQGMGRVKMKKPSAGRYGYSLELHISNMLYFTRVPSNKKIGNSPQKTF